MTALLSDAKLAAGGTANGAARRFREVHRRTGSADAGFLSSSGHASLYRLVRRNRTRGAEGCGRKGRLALSHAMKARITSDADQFSLAFAAKAKNGPEGRDRAVQGENQVQGAGALADEDPSAHRRWPQGGEREYGIRPPLELERANRRWARARRLQHWPRRPCRRICGRLDKKRPVGLATLIWTNIGNSGTMELRRTTENPISDREPVSLTRSA